MQGSGSVPTRNPETVGVLVATMLSRRALLRGRIAGGGAAIRPPWAVQEAAFSELCSRCGDCGSVCGEGIIRRGDGGFPAVDFQLGECTFCGDCVSACDSGALSPASYSAGSPPWQLDLAIADNCLALNRVVCRSCSEQCEQQAIRFRPAPGGVSRPEIISTQCNGCGACIGSCPVAALSLNSSLSSSGFAGEAIQEMHK